MEVARISVNDVQELNYAVDPWQLQMQQISPGKLHADLYIAQLGDVFVSEEYWSQRISGSGQTPPGYITLAGPIDREGFSWCGAPTSRQRLAYTPECREVDFLAGDGQPHWTLLIPTKLAREYLGEEALEKLSGDQSSLEADPRFVQQLSSAVTEVLTLIKKNRIGNDRRLFGANSQASLLAAASQLLLNVNELSLEEASPNCRSKAYRKARQYIESLDHPISVAELAKYSKVSRRTLEIAFIEESGVSPRAFMQRARLNSLRRDLRRASPNSSSVTLAAQNWGFTELGRTAGYYYRMFDEYPSETLKKCSDISNPRYSDIIINKGMGIGKLIPQDQ